MQECRWSGRNFREMARVNREGSDDSLYPEIGLVWNTVTRPIIIPSSDPLRFLLHARILKSFNHRVRRFKSKLINSREAWVAFWTNNAEQVSAARRSFHHRSYQRRICWCAIEQRAFEDGYNNIYVWNPNRLLGMTICGTSVTTNWHVSYDFLSVDRAQLSISLNTTETQSWIELWKT